MAVSKDVRERESSLAWRVLFAVSNVLIFAILYANNVLVSRYSNCRYRWSSIEICFRSIKRDEPEKVELTQAKAKVDTRI
jgi:hypothetical protein